MGVVLVGAGKVSAPFWAWHGKTWLPDGVHYAAILTRCRRTEPTSKLVDSLTDRSAYELVRRVTVCYTKCWLIDVYLGTGRLVVFKVKVKVTL
jgi:hypothetical protein